MDLHHFQPRMYLILNSTEAEKKILLVEVLSFTNLFTMFMMVLFLSILDWSHLRPFGMSDGSVRRATCNLHKKGDPAAPVAKSVPSL